MKPQTLTLLTVFIAFAAGGLLFWSIGLAIAQNAQTGFTLDCTAQDMGAGIQVTGCSGIIPYTPTPSNSTPTPINTPTPTPGPTPTTTPTPTPGQGTWHPTGILVREGVDMGDICCADPAQGINGPRYQPLIDPTIDRILLAPGGIHDSTRQQEWCDEIESVYPGIAYYFYHTSLSVRNQLSTTCPAVGYYHYILDAPNNVQAIADQIHNAGKQFVLGIDGSRSDVNSLIPLADVAIVQLGQACKNGTLGQAVDNLAAHPNLMVGFTVGPDFLDLRDILNGVDSATAQSCHDELVQRGIPWMRYDHPLDPGEADTAIANIRGITIQPRPTSHPQCVDILGILLPCWPPLGTP